MIVIVGSVSIRSLIGSWGMNTKRELVALFCAVSYINFLLVEVAPKKKLDKGRAFLCTLIMFCFMTGCGSIFPSVSELRSKLERYQ